MTLDVAELPVQLGPSRVARHPLRVVTGYGWGVSLSQSG